MPKRAIVVDFASIAKLAREDSSPAATRIEQVKLINAVFDGLMLAIEREPWIKEMLKVWSDTVVGEGLLFKSIINNIPSLVNFVVDGEKETKTVQSEVDELILRYRPSSVVVPLTWPLLQSAPSNIRRRLRSSAQRVLESCKQFEIETAWDTGFVPVDTPDTAADTIKIMAWLQDRGLEPSTWILDLPISESRVDIMIGRAHADGTSNVSLLFRTEHGAVGEDIDRVRQLDSLANSRGKGQLYIGSQHFNAPLESLMDDAISASEAAEHVATIIIDIGTQYDREDTND